MRVQKKKNKKLPFVIISILALAAIIGSYFAYAYMNKVWPFHLNQGSSTKSDSRTNTINYNPPTEQEVASSQDGKKNSQQDTPSTSGSASKTISLVISYAGTSDDKGSIEVDAYTPDVIEGTGTCVATLTNGSSMVTGQSQAMVDARSSICQPIIIPLSKFPVGGTWHLIVKYNSPAYSGTAQAVDLEVKK